MNDIMIMVGLPGSGKSTFIDNTLLKRRKNYQIVCRDDIRLSLGQEYEARLEPVVTMVEKVTCRALMERGLNIIIDETNTRIKYVQEHIDLANEYGYRKTIIALDTHINICKERREEIIEVIDRKYQQLSHLIMEADHLDYDEWQWYSIINGKFQFVKYRYRPILINY